MKSMKLPILVAVLIILPVIALVAARALVIRVPVGMVGVRTNVWTTGLVEEDFMPGWHRDLGPMHQWALFDSTVQTLEMSEKKYHSTRGREALILKTADGYDVILDVTVKYRIKDKEAHKMYQQKGPGDAYKRTFEENALEACRAIFGKMKTEDFYNPEEKAAKTGDALTMLQGEGAAISVEVLEILIRDVRFDPGYERKIKDKKLADQEALLNKSKALAAEQKGITKKIEAGTEAMIQEIQAQKKAALVQMQAELTKVIAKINGEAHVYETETKSGGITVFGEPRHKGLENVTIVRFSGSNSPGEAAITAVDGKLAYRAPDSATAGAAVSIAKGETKALYDGEDPMKYVDVTCEADAELEGSITVELRGKVGGDLYKAQRLAEGQLELKKAEAEGERLRNEAMAGAGGRIMAALEAAKHLELGDITVSTQQTDFLDIDAMIRKLGVSEEDAGKP